MEVKHTGYPTLEEGEHFEAVEYIERQAVRRMVRQAQKEQQTFQQKKKPAGTVMLS